MRVHLIGSRRRSRADREQLLAGVADAGRLGELIAAATAAGREDELSGLTAALAAFRSAAEASAAAGRAAGTADAVPGAPVARRRSLLKPALSGILATKIIAGAASAAAVGGIALAASTGHLGNGGPHATGPGSAISATHSMAGQLATGNGSGPPAALDSPGSASASGSALSSFDPALGTPSARVHALAGLCQAWRAHEHHAVDHGRWRSSPAFRTLVAAAGTDRDVDPFCDVLLGPADSASGSAATTSTPTTHPTHPAQPTHPLPPTDDPAPPTYPSHPVQPTHPVHSSPSTPPTVPTDSIRPSTSPTPSPTVS